MELGGVPVPAKAWRWLTFVQVEDVPFIVQYFKMGFCLTGRDRMCERPWSEMGSFPSSTWDMDPEQAESCVLLYPMWIEEECILGRSEENPTARMGKLCNLGEVVEERFCAITSFDHPMTFHSTLFDSGYVFMLDGYGEKCFGNSVLRTRLFHVDRPDEYLCPMTMIGVLQCFGCQRPQPICDCMFKVVVGNNLSTQSLWQRARQDLLSVAEQNKAVLPTTWNWLSFRSFYANHNGICSFLTLKINLSDSPGCSDPLVLNLLTEHNSFYQGSSFDLKLNLHVQRVVGKTLLRTPSTTEQLTNEVIETAKSQNGAHSAKGSGNMYERGEVRKYLCSICSKAFYMKHHLQVHIVSVHGTRRDFPCDQCEMTFATDTKRQRHVRCVHDQHRPYICLNCDMSFFQLSNLKRHMLRRHPTETSIAMARTQR